MADTVSRAQRSWNMSRIRSKDTSIEVKVRKYLFKQGFRFRKNVSSLPGKPDIVLPKYKTVIFVHGCFWHRHEGCKYATSPGSNIDYWQRKFQNNITNDKRHRTELTELGWHVIVIWECELKNSFETTMACVVKELQSFNTTT